MTFADLRDGATIFLDANIFVYHFAQHPTFGAACTALLDRIERRLTGLAPALQALAGERPEAAAVLQVPKGLRGRLANGLNALFDGCKDLRSADHGPRHRTSHGEQSGQERFGDHVADSSPTVAAGSKRNRPLATKLMTAVRAMAHTNAARTTRRYGPLR